MSHIDRLLNIMQRLRDPVHGCPWDKAQDFSSVVPYTLEEAYEVADAIANGNMEDLRNELGDLLFQVVFHSQLAAEQGMFSFDDVAGSISDKMERRHPHVFNGNHVGSALELSEAWETHKQRERQAMGNESVLDDIPLAMPALTRAAKLGKRAARLGFEWPTVQGAMEKLHEEVAEVEEALAMAAPNGKLSIEEQQRQEQLRGELENELGDVLFSVVNVCRHLHIDPENALRRVNAKFERRFRHVESRVRELNSASALDTASNITAPLSVMDAYWNEAKLKEKE